MTARLESIERAALVSLFDSADESLRSELGIAEFETGAAFAGLAAVLPASAIVLNRVIGLGLEGSVQEADVARLVDTYNAAGVARYFVHVVPGTDASALAGWLEGGGLEKTRGWMKFTRGTTPTPDVPTTLRVEKIGPERGGDFARIACAAFDLGEAAEPWMARLPQAPGWHAFMSFDGDTPAGTGGLFIKDGIAWSDWGATAPEFRSRGSQSALLKARIDFAIAQGCTKIGTCTGEDVPGDPQHSYKNILKLGFEEAYVRENYALPKQAG